MSWSGKNNRRVQVHPLAQSAKFIIKSTRLYPWQPLSLFTHILVRVITPNLVEFHCKARCTPSHPLANFQLERPILNSISWLETTLIGGPSKMDSRRSHSKVETLAPTCTTVFLSKSRGTLCKRFEQSPLRRVLWRWYPAGSSSAQSASPHYPILIALLQSPFYQLQESFPYKSS